MVIGYEVHLSRHLLSSSKYGIVFMSGKCSWSFMYIKSVILWPAAQVYKGIGASSLLLVEPESVIVEINLSPSVDASDGQKPIAQPA